MVELPFAELGDAGGESRFAGTDPSICLLHAALKLYINSRRFPGGTSGKNLPANAGRHKRCGFDLCMGKIPWRRAWQPTPVFLPGESHGQRSLAGYSR